MDRHLLKVTQPIRGPASYSGGDLPTQKRQSLSKAPWWCRQEMLKVLRREKTHLAWLEGRAWAKKERFC